MEIPTKLVSLKCGPKNDEKIIKLEVPLTIKSIGIFHSGGLDSTILLYLVTKYFSEYDTTIFTINKTVGDNEKNSNRVLEQMGLTNLNHKIININSSLPNNKILPTIISDILISNLVDFAFSAGNAVPAEGTISSTFKGPIRILKNPAPHKICIPFLNILKYHVLDLYYKYGVEYLIPFTHSCTELTTGYCGECWFCNERKWAFKQLNKDVIMGM